MTPPDPGGEWRLLGPPLDNSVGVPKPATARMTGAPVDWPQLGRTHENRWLSKRGTERSNPFPSSGESVANSVIAKAGPRLLSAAGTSGFAIRMLRRILTTCATVAPPSTPTGRVSMCPAELRPRGWGSARTLAGCLSVFGQSARCTAYRECGRSRLIVEVFTRGAAPRGPPSGAGIGI